MIRVLCVANMLLLVVGQVLFKLGATGHSLKNMKDIVLLLFTPFIFSALVLYALTTCLWIYILNKADLSLAYPYQALAFPIVTVISILLFHECVPGYRWIGLFLICAGVWVATR